MIPLPLNKFPEGDDDTYSWATRICKGANQFLLDLMSEWQIHNKSQTLKIAVLFLYTYLPAIMKDNDTEMSRRLKIIFSFREAQRLADERDQVLADLTARAILIEKTEHPEIKAELERTAIEYANMHNVPWPPPEIPLMMYDTEAKYVMERVLAAASAQNVSRITSRDLLVNCHWKSNIVIPILERLERNKYIELEREKRSGPPTLWITIPTIPNRAAMPKPQVPSSQAKAVKKEKPFDIDELMKDDGPF